MPKLITSNATFLVIFNHCELLYNLISSRPSLINILDSRREEKLAFGTYPKLHQSLIWISLVSFLFLKLVLMWLELFFLRFEKPQELTWVAKYYYVAATGTKRKVATNIRNFLYEQNVWLAFEPSFHFHEGIIREKWWPRLNWTCFLHLFGNTYKKLFQNRAAEIFFRSEEKPHANWHVEHRKA